MGYLFKHLPPEEKVIHEKIGWGKRMGFGEKPALLVVDMARAWTDPESFMGTDMSETLENINKLLAIARQTKPKIPVIFTVMSYDPSGKEFTPVMLKKRSEKRVTNLIYGSKWVEIDPILNRQSDELLLVKKHNSCFMMTNLLELLIGAKVDTVIITGCTTSGCIQGTAIDAFEYGFYSIVVKEAVNDRDPLMGAYALLSMDARVSDVVSLDEAIEYLSKFKGNNQLKL